MIAKQSGSCSTAFFIQMNKFNFCFFWLKELFVLPPHHSMFLRNQLQLARICVKIWSLLIKDTSCPVTQKIRALSLCAIFHQSFFFVALFHLLLRRKSYLFKISKVCFRKMSLNSLNTIWESSLWVLDLSNYFRDKFWSSKLFLFELRISVTNAHVEVLPDLLFGLVEILGYMFVTKRYQDYDRYLLIVEFVFLENQELSCQENVTKYS